MEKILLDTDIGSDIDDAVCLAYLLAQPQCDLLGITTVSGEPVQRARIADAICRNMGRDVPIYPGVENPLPDRAATADRTQAAKLDAWPHRTDYPAGEAIEFLRQTIRAHPHEITLLTIGPLTNIALLFALDPEIPGLLKEHVLMCGVFTADRSDMPRPDRVERQVGPPRHRDGLSRSDARASLVRPGCHDACHHARRRGSPPLRYSSHCVPCWILPKSGSRRATTSLSTIRWPPSASSTPHVCEL